MLGTMNPRHTAPIGLIFSYKAELSLVRIGRLAYRVEKKTNSNLLKQDWCNHYKDRPAVINGNR